MKATSSLDGSFCLFSGKASVDISVKGSAMIHDI